MSGETVTFGRIASAQSEDEEQGRVMPMPEPRKAKDRTILMCVCLGVVQVILAGGVFMELKEVKKNSAMAPTGDKTQTTEQALMASIEVLKASIDRLHQGTKTASEATKIPADAASFEEIKASIEVLKASIYGVNHGKKTAEHATKIPVDATAFVDGINFHNCNIQNGSAQPAKFFQLNGAMSDPWRAKAAVKIFEHWGLLKDEAKIVDMGAGYHALQSMLPPGYPYQAVDVMERVPGSGTLLCNVNQGQFPFFNEKIAAFAFLGSFEYMLHKLAILTMCRKHNAPVVMQYNVGKALNGGSYQWVAPMDASQLAEAAQRAGYKLHWPACEIHDLPKGSASNFAPCHGGRPPVFIYFEVV